MTLDLVVEVGVNRSGALIQELMVDDHEKLQQVRAAIVALGEAVLPELIAAAESAATDKERWRLLVTIAQIGGRQATPLMISCLHSSSSAIRVLAAQSLAALGEAKAVEPLISLLVDGDSTRSLSWIADALGELGDERAYAPLITFLHRADSGPDRCSAIRALTRLRRSEALEHVRNYANDPDHHVRDRVREAVRQL